MHYSLHASEKTTRDRVADYIDKGLSVRQIADLEGISTQAVYKHLKALEISPPSVKATA